LITMKQQRRTFLTVGLVAAAALVTAPRHAAAQAPAAGMPVEVIAMYGTQAAHAYIDPQLASFTGRLTKPPLSSFNSYARLEDIRIAAPFGQTTQRALPGGETLDLVVRPKPDAPGRFTLHAEIHQGTGAPKVVDLTVPEKKSVFIGGQHYKDGNMVLAFTLNP
jgi:hypothetical protein